MIRQRSRCPGAKVCRIAGGAGHQRPRRADRTASAATPAVEVRSTCRPSRTGTRRPRERGQLVRRRCRPPGRPPARSRRSAGSATVDSGTSASSCSTNAAARRRAGGPPSRWTVRRAGHHRAARPGGPAWPPPGRWPPTARRACRPARRATGHRPGRRPGHDLVHPDLGHRLHGQLAPVALGDALHHDQPRVGRGRVRPGGDGRARGVPRPTAVTTARGRAAPAVGEQQRLADAQPLHGGRVVALGPVQRSSRVAPAGSASTQEQRARLTQRSRLRRGR